MKKQLTLETDKRKAKEGEYIDIRWDCPGCPDSLILIFDSGHKTDKIVTKLQWQVHYQACGRYRRKESDSGDQGTRDKQQESRTS